MCAADNNRPASGSVVTGTMAEGSLFGGRLADGLTHEF
jgi:hypothetical protein